MLESFFRIYNILYNEEDIHIDPKTKLVVAKKEEYHISKIQAESVEIP